MGVIPIPAKTKKLLLAIFFLNVIEFLQSGMIAFAARPIMGEIGSSLEEFGLINGVYASIAIIMIAQQHWVVERVGWRRYLQFSLAFFIVGAFVCYWSNSFYSFLLGRSIMALGGASFMTSARLLVLLLPVGLLRLVGIRYFVISMIIGVVSAPFLASVIVTHDQWNMIFVILIFFALIAWIFATIGLPNEIVKPKYRMTRSSPMIIMLLILGGSSFFYVFRGSSYNFYSNSSMLLMMVFASCVFLLLFILRLHKRQFDKPLLHVRPIFQNKLFVLSTIFSFIFYVFNGSSNYILPYMLQKGMNFSWGSIGLYMTTGLSMSWIAWKIFSKTIAHFPNLKKYMVVGALCLAFYGWVLSGLTPQATLQGDILPALLANGLLMIFFMTPVTGAGFRSLQGDDMLFSHAMQLRNIIAQLALSIGVSLGIAFMQWHTTIHFSYLGESFTLFNDNFTSTLNLLTGAFSKTLTESTAQSAALSQLQTQLQQQSILMAANDYFHYVMILGLICAGIFLVQKVIK